MKLTLSEDPDEKSADLMAMGGLLGYLYSLKDPKAITEGWVGFFLNVYDAIMMDNNANEFVFSFRGAVRDQVRGAG
jgi:hypothetical protein